ncbi:MAG: hypothetical protein DRP79_00910 [Planctomycetota bacterium]|nr:MAG: hypothetical protein DRP79_00910 [Planctomycetota bacterium]
MTTAQPARPSHAKRQKVSFIEPCADFNGYNLVRLPLLGHLYLGAILKRNGHDVRCYSENLRRVYHHRRGITEKRILESDAVGISIMTPTANRGYAIADAVRKANPKVRIIIGGSHATALPDEALRHADAVVTGEGESKILEAVNSDTKGIIRGERVQNLDDLPIVDLKLLQGFRPKLLRLTPIATSRGCPFDCSFCSVTQMFGRRYRFRSNELVLEELERRTKAGFTNFFFYDDNFAADKTRTKKLLEGMLRRNIHIYWACQARVDIARDDELLDLMRRTGCVTVALGVESVNPRTLVDYNKKQSVTDVVNCIVKLKAHEIRALCMFVMGSDSDTSLTVRETVRFLKRWKPRYAQFSILFPIPGTRFYDRMLREKRIWTRNWSLYDGSHVVTYPKNFTPIQLLDQVRWIWKQFYSMPWLTGYSVFRYFLWKWERINKKYLLYLPTVKTPKRLTQADALVAASERSA